MLEFNRIRQSSVRNHSIVANNIFEPKSSFTGSSSVTVFVVVKIGGTLGLCLQCCVSKFDGIEGRGVNFAPIMAQ